MTREYTKRLLNLIEEGILTKDSVIRACLDYMSEAEVKDMCVENEFVDLEQDRLNAEYTDQEAEDLLNDFNYVGSRHHY
jgi:hypothetical protein